jgi:hypothetical protein
MRAINWEIECLVMVKPCLTGKEQKQEPQSPFNGRVMGNTHNAFTPPSRRGSEWRNTAKFPYFIYRINMAFEVGEINNPNGRPVSEASRLRSEMRDAEKVDTRNPIGKIED